MRLKIAAACFSLLLVVFLAGCGGSGSGGSVFSPPAGGGLGGDVLAGVTPDPSDPGDPGDPGIGNQMINPEPASMALLGGGLLAYGFLRRKKKR